ncbi:MAG: class I SAM-dependent methyltransferase [bacterium]
MKTDPGARAMIQWFEDESFWEMLYPMLFNDGILKKSEADAAKIIDLVSPRGKAVLDLCCGPGRMALAFAARGYHVTGVDRTRFYLEQAKRHAEERGVRIEWIEDDMRRFKRPDAFDLVLNMLTSFGYFEDREEDRVVLENIFHSLKAGGYCLIDIMGKEVLARIFQATTSEALPDGSILVMRHKIIDEWTRVETEWIHVRDGSSKIYKFHHALYSGRELKDRLQQVGFRKVRLLGDLDGQEYGYGSARLYALAQK